MRNPRRLQRSLIVAVFVAFALWILLQLATLTLWVSVLVLLALILAAAIMPIVRVIRSVRLPPNGWRIPSALAVLIIYVSTAIVLSLAAYWVGRPLVVDLIEISSSLPQLAIELTAYLDALALTFGITGILPSPMDIASQIQGLTSRAVDALALVTRAAGGIISFLFQLFIVLTLALFLVAESERIFTFWIGLFPPSQRDKVEDVTRRIGQQVGYWLLGQVIVATIVGTLAGLASALVGIPYAVLIGLVTAVLSIAPVLGPGLMVIPVFLLGLSKSLIVALLGVGIFYGLSQLEGNVLSPLITGRAVRVSPLLIIISLAYGLALYGAVGALIAVPVTASLQIIFHEVFLPWLRARQGVTNEDKVS